MRVHVQSLLPCSVEQMWAAIQSTALLAEVTPGKLGPPLAPDPIPARWTDARRIELRLPGIGRRVIDVVSVDPARHTVETLEHDPLVRRWHHVMHVWPGPEGQAYYSDTVKISAGVLTPLVFGLAQCLYWTRHRNWRRVAAEIARTGSQASP